MTVELPLPLGLPDIDPIGRSIARARKVAGIGKGFEEHGAEVVTGLPIPDELLGESKGQVHVERHFHFVKDPLFVDALFVKRPECVEALGYVLLLACLLYSLLERRLRQSGVPVPLSLTSSASSANGPRSGAPSPKSASGADER